MHFVFEVLLNEGTDILKKYLIETILPEYIQQPLNYFG